MTAIGPGRRVRPRAAAGRFEIDDQGWFVVNVVSVLPPWGETDTTAWAIIDGQRWRWGGLENGSPKLGRYGRSGVVFKNLLPDDFRRLAGAGEVELQIRQFEIKLQPEHLAALREMAGLPWKDAPAR